MEMLIKDGPVIAYMPKRNAVIVEMSHPANGWIVSIECKDAELLDELKLKAREIFDNLP